MITINNTDLEPMPLHDKGKWIWNGYEITTTGVTEDGEQYQRKGMWMWVSEDTQNAWMANATVQEINDFYRPKNQSCVTTGKAINAALIILAGIALTAMGLLLLIS